jgi:hypothetical protein
MLKDGLLLNKSLQRLGLLNTRLSSEGNIIYSTGFERGEE